MAAYPNEERGTCELGELVDEGRVGGGVAVDGDDAGVATHVAELVVVGPWQDFSTEAAHEPYTWQVDVVVGDGAG